MCCSNLFLSILIGTDQSNAPLRTNRLLVKALKASQGRFGSPGIATDSVLAQTRVSSILNGAAEKLAAGKESFNGIGGRTYEDARKTLAEVIAREQGQGAQGVQAAAG
jgi:hypothetical protein